MPAGPGLFSLHSEDQEEVKEEVTEEEEERKDHPPVLLIEPDGGKSQHTPSCSYLFFLLDGDVYFRIASVSVTNMV